MKRLTLNDLSAEEKLRLICSDGFWHTLSLGGKLPRVSVSDGPVGLRKEVRYEDGRVETVPSVAYPAVQSLANSWSREGARAMGEALADDCIDNEVDILLAPGVNIKRCPLNGRNFEYFSEDPYLAGTLAYEYIDGLQQSGVGACLKHYYCNNLEYNRFEQSSEVDERTLREIYLKPFELAAKAKPVSVMCAYNRINGVYASENKKGFRILREEFGFDGAIYSDWEAVRDRTAACKAGLDIEFPFNQKNYEKLVADYHAGLLSDEELNACAARVLDLVYRVEEMKTKRQVKHTQEERRALARKLAEESIVLLKNEGALPLQKGGSVAVSGEYACPKRYSLFAGGGSSMVRNDEHFFDLAALLRVRTGAEVRYDPAFCTQGIVSNWQKPHKAFHDAAVCETAIVCVGTGSDIEYEGGDRANMRLPGAQEEMILEIARRNENTVVVIFAGSPVDMSAWKDEVSAIVWAGFCGESGGEALADILAGLVCPSGKLSETMPLSLELTPAYGSYCDALVARYEEGLDVGYRYYDTYNIPVAFPFGHGLSYADFSYSALKAQAGEKLTLSFALENTSDIPAKEVYEVYVHTIENFVYRPEKELKAYGKVEIGAHEKKEIEVVLEPSAFAYWSTATDGWKVDDGVYEIMIGASSRDIRLSLKVEIKAGKLTVL